VLIGGIKRDENISILGTRAESDVMSVSEQSRAGSWQSIAGTKLLVLCVAQNRTPVTARIYERFEISPL
jgi:hypothetical protein